MPVSHALGAWRKRRRRSEETMAVDSRSAVDQPFARPSAAELDRLLTTLEVKVVFLSECFVSPVGACSCPLTLNLASTTV